MQGGDAGSVACTVDVVSDAHLALKLQLEEAGAGVLSNQSLETLALGLDAPQRCESDFQLASQLRLQEVGAGKVSVETIAALAACENDAVAARRLFDAQTQVSYDQLYGEAVARSMDMVQDRERDQDMGRREAYVGSTSTVRCPICLDHHPYFSTLVLGDCEHRFCTICARKYVEGIGREGTLFPIPCPECREDLSPCECLATLAGTGESYSTFERFIIAKMYMCSVRYCPNEKCGQVYDWFDDPAFVTSPLRYQLMCWVCSNAFCAKCKVPWHEGMSCDVFQANLNGDALLAELSRSGKLRPCPNCGELIEKRIGDCNFIRCRCNHGFCHSCGISYRSITPTANNQHGTPGCSCGLFSDLVEDDIEGGAPVNQPAGIEIPRPNFAGVNDPGAQFGILDGGVNGDRPEQRQRLGHIFEAANEPQAVIDVAEAGVLDNQPHGNHMLREMLGLEDAPRVDIVAPPSEVNIPRFADVNNENNRDRIQQIGDIRQLEEEDNASMGCPASLVARDDKVEENPVDDRNPKRGVQYSVGGAVSAIERTELATQDSAGSPEGPFASASGMDALGIDSALEIIEPRRQASINIGDLLSFGHPQRRHLSKNMARALRANICPVRGCERHFASRRSLEQHLTATDFHPIYICCGRPFVSKESLNQHRRSGSCY